MTREEAIDILTHGFGTWGRANGKTRFGEAIKMAIEALQQTDSDTISRRAAIDAIKKSRFLVDAMEKVIKLPSAQPEPCADTVSRTAAIEAQERIMSDHPLDGYEDGRLLINALKALPSAQPDGEYISRQAVTESDLIDWYVNSVDESEPVWTEEHIHELFNDFYLIPKED